MPRLLCYYTGDPRETLDNAVTEVVERFGGEMGDSGWGCGERDLEADFGRLTKVRRTEIAAEIIALGCVDAQWM